MEEQRDPELAASQPAPAEMLHSHTLAAVSATTPATGTIRVQEVDTQLCHGGREAAAPLALGPLPSLAEHGWRGPERGSVDSAVEAEMVQEVATKIKRAGDPISVFLTHTGENRAAGNEEPGLDFFCHRAGVRNWRHMLLFSRDEDGHLYFK